jgi:hypothetical protein
MRFTGRGRTGRLAAALALLALGGCVPEPYVQPPTGSAGLDLNYIGFPCDPGGARFDETGTYDRPLPLALGRPQVVTATLEGPARTCPGGGTFVRLRWHANFASPGRILRARLIGCEACTVVYDEKPSAYGHPELKGEAVLHFPRQRLAFEVTGTAAGIGDVALFACLGEHCIDAAGATTVFDVR